MYSYCSTTLTEVFPCFNLCIFVVRFMYSYCSTTLTEVFPCFNTVIYVFLFFRFMYSYCLTTLTEVFPCFNTVICVFLLLSLCILIVRLPWLRFFHAFSSVVRQIPGYNSPSRARLALFQNFCVVLKIFVLLYVLFVLCRSVYCLCVNVYCTTATQLQLTNISYRIIYIISYHISYDIYHISYHISIRTICQPVLFSEECILFCSDIRTFNSLPRSLTNLKNGKAKFKVALKRNLNTQFYFSVCHPAVL
jgi:hypothetical protein